MNQWHNDLAERISLDGSWEFSLAGQSGAIQTPGCWEAQGYPRRVDGPAMYRRTVSIPAAWAGRIVQLQFDAVSYHVEVEVNGVPVGSHTGSWSPFALDVSHALRPGQENEIRLTVYKPGDRFPLRESLAGFLPDVCLMFGGVWQSARLVAFDRPALSEIALRADAQTGEVRVAARVHQCVGASIAVEVCAPDGATVAIRRPTLSGDMILAALTIPNPQLWSPDNPALYSIEVRLEGAGGVLASARRTFGFRALTRQGDQLLFNGAPVCLRGVLNWGWYPDLLCPAPGDDAIRDEFRRVRALGYNMVKLCLYVPSPRYFEIADEEGMFLWLELPMWLPQVTPRLRQQAPVEYADILAAVHHHPSVVIYSLGCELGRDVDAAFVAQLDAIARERVGGVLFCDNSGSGEAYGGAFDFADFNDYHFYADIQFFDPLVDHFSRDWKPPRPWIFGEFCDADDYRDLDEIAAHYGGELPWWATEKNPLHPTDFVAYQEQRARMAKVNTGLDDHALMQLSRRQSFAVRKAVLEKVRARAGMGGYVVTSIRDTPLASSSMFDDLNRPKYEPAAFRAFNADTVLLLGRGRARTWTRGGDRPAPFEPYCVPAGRPVAFEIILAHAGAPLPGGRLAWQVFDENGRPYAGDGQAVGGPLSGGRPQVVGRMAFQTPETEKALTYRVEVTFDLGDGRRIGNTWPLWIFPEVTAWPAEVALRDPAGVLVGLDDLWAAAGKNRVGESSIVLTSVLDEGVLGHLRRGGAALLLQQGDRPLPALALPFWREGIKIIADHPAMHAFPHAGFVDMQFYGLATDWAFQTDRLNTVLPDVGEITPALRRLDARRFFLTDYLLDLRVGRGWLIASTLRFQGGLGDQPAGLRFNLAGRWLLLNLLNTLKEEGE